MCAKCHCTMKEGERGPFSSNLRVRIKDNNSSPHVKFHRFLFPFSCKFPDLNFASYVLYIYIVYLCGTHSEPGLPVEQRVHLDAEKKSNVHSNYKRQEKNMRNAYFTRKLNIPISHNGEVIEFLKLKVQCKLLFSNFGCRMFSFCQRLCPA